MDVLDADWVLDDVVVVGDDGLAHAAAEGVGDAQRLHVLLQDLEQAVSGRWKKKF